jgi:hypothetical protein
LLAAVAVRTAIRVRYYGVPQWSTVRAQLCACVRAAPTRLLAACVLADQICRSLALAVLLSGSSGLQVSGTHSGTLCGQQHFQPPAEPSAWIRCWLQVQGHGILSMHGMDGLEFRGTFSLG